MRVLTVVGARPQFVKAAAVSRAFAAEGGVEETLVHTGQHFDANMSEVFFTQMEIPRPRYHLDVHGVSHGAMTGRMLERCEEVIVTERPDWVLVYGDTNSTLAGALAARKLHVRVAHVEAGLRSFRMTMPEEVNRIVTDRISDALYCPTDAAVQNLKREGFDHFAVRVVRSGDVMQDAVAFYQPKALAESTIVRDLGLTPARFFLCTLHRAENTDDPARLAALVEALNRVAVIGDVVLPMHPRTRDAIGRLGLPLDARAIDPVGYFDMLALTAHASMVLTDSGGLQKEAFFAGRFCVTLRDETEWLELVEGGYNELAGTDPDRIVAAVQRRHGQRVQPAPDLYGGGQAAARIARDLLAHA